MKIEQFLPVLLLSIASGAYAQSGADVLLESTGTTVEAVPAADQTANQQFISDMNGLKLTDTFLHTLFMEWKGEKIASADVNRWFLQIFKGNFNSAAHQWNAIQENIPENLIPAARQAWVYLTWRMKLPQTFVDTYMTAKMSGLPATRLSSALDEVLAREVTMKWTAKERPYLNEAAMTWLLALPTPMGAELELAAWAGRQNPEHALRLLERVPMGHPLSSQLAATAVLAFARKGEIGEAGKLLKRRVEPELNKTRAAEKLANHYLTLGRLLYQAGAFEASESFYAKVPRGLPEFLPARAERTWTLLRLGRVGDLRGELASLSHQVFADRFLPEVALVRSISNLKLCRYDDVAKDFNAFITTHKVWAQKIQIALNSPETAKIDEKDFPILTLEKAIKTREAELAQLRKLATDSIRAALPAVGEQAHWVNAQKDVAAALETQKRQLVANKQRFWRNREVVLTEAIRKLKFVRLEAMSQVQMAANGAPTKVPEMNTDTAKKIQAAREHGSQTYVMDGVYWPDELFSMHAMAQTRCGGKAL